MSGLLFFAFAVTLSSSFEGGNIRDVQHLGPTSLRISIPGETDQDGRNRQANWYYFRLDHVKGKALTLELTNLAGEYNYQPNKGAVTADTPPYFSNNNITWQPLTDFTYDPAAPKLILRLTPTYDRVWIAHIPPYTNAHLTRLYRDIRRHPAFRENIVGRTLGGRPLRHWTITDPASPAAPRKVIWLMARQHSWEASTSWVAEGAVRYLLSDDPEAVRIRRAAIFHILPLCDPDGVARGGVRFNAQGFDVNRNWDTFNPRQNPEIAALHGAVAAWVKAGSRTDLFLAMHNTETAEYLEGPPTAGGGAFAALGERFFQLLTTQTTFGPTRPLSWAEPTTTAGKPGRMTVVQGLYRDFHLPAFLSEQRVSLQPKLNRRPTTEDRLQFGAALAKAMWQAVTP
ncbi:MAG TPA: M14-type cytosolic carboxypeptidase [Paludibaculum sp.]|jgi:hypothetical protein